MTTPTTLTGAASVVAAMERMTEFLESAESILEALRRIREEIPNEEYEALEEKYPAIEALVCAAADLEYQMEAPINAE